MYVQIIKHSVQISLIKTTWYEKKTWKCRGRQCIRLLDSLGLSLAWVLCLLTYMNMQKQNTIISQDENRRRCQNPGGWRCRHRCATQLKGAQQLPGVNYGHHAKTAEVGRLVYLHSAADGYSPVRTPSGASAGRKIFMEYHVTWR